MRLVIRAGIIAHMPERASSAHHPTTHPAPPRTATTAVIIVDHGSRRPAANAMLEHFVAAFAQNTDYPIVESAHMGIAHPSIADAFDRCVARGATRVLVCPYFLLPGKHWDKDIPNLTRRAAEKYSAVDYLVTAPIGLHPMMQQVIQHRLDYCLAHAIGNVDECESCKGTGRCAFQHVQTTT